MTLQPRSSGSMRALPSCITDMAELLVPKSMPTRVLPAAVAAVNFRCWRWQ